jgi:hypothetical protein
MRERKTWELGLVGERKRREKLWSRGFNRTSVRPVRSLSLTQSLSVSSSFFNSLTEYVYI